MDALLHSTVVFAFILALSLLLERFLELLKSIYDFIDCRLGLETYWSKKAQQLSEEIDENLKALDKSKRDIAEKLLKQYADKHIRSDGVVVISGDLFRSTTVRFVAKIIAITAGICFAFLFDLDIVEMWQKAADTKASQVAHQLPEWVRITLTGTAMGLGSGPIHKIITTIEKQRKKAEQKRAGGSNA